LTLTKEEIETCVGSNRSCSPKIEFTEWTPDGHLRHSKFVGLREDKEVREVVREDSKFVADLKARV